MSLLHEPGAVVMAVYRPNRALLERQIHSLRAQSVSDWRCIIGVDGLDQEALSLVQASVDGDPRFDVIEFQENVGVYAHFERLLARVPEGVAWVSLADQDDYWYRNKFARLLAALDRPGVTAVLGQARLVSDKGDYRGRTERRPGDLVETILRNQLTGSLAVVSSEVLASAFPFPSANSMAIHDHWLAVCAAATGRIALVDEVLQDYVQHGSNVLGERRPTRVRDIARSVRRAGGVRSLINEVTIEQWAWRVSMASTVLARSPSLDDRRVVERLAQGIPSAATARTLLRAVLRRQLSVVAAVGMLVASAKWSGREPDSP